MTAFTYPYTVTSDLYPIGYSLNSAENACAQAESPVGQHLAGSTQLKKANIVSYNSQPLYLCAPAPDGSVAARWQGTWQIDDTAPTITNFTPVTAAVNGYYGKSATFTANVQDPGTASGLNSASAAQYSSWTGLGNTAYTVAGGAATFTAPSSSVPSGSYALTINAADLATNTASIHVVILEFRL